MEERTGIRLILSGMWVVFLIDHILFILTVDRFSNFRIDKNMPIILGGSIGF